MAKFRAKVPRKGPLPFRYVFLLSFVFFLLSTAAGLWIVNNGIEPTLMRYAEFQTKNIASEVINRAIKKETTNIDEIINVTPSGNGKVSAVKLKTEVVTRLLANTVEQIQKNLRSAEKGELSSIAAVTNTDIDLDHSKNKNGIIWYVPLGQATNSALFGNLGPKIPIRFNAVGDVQPDIKMNAKPMGINNTWIEVSLQLKVEVQIITPFATKVTELQQTIPLGAGLIPGEVPQYFNGGSGSTPAIQLPEKK
ncbi:sporulation protein YunB [Bacillota bacterium Lsc_1132]